MKIGVIAEEINDVEVLYELTCKFTPEESFSFKKFVGHGCGKLRKKCTAWAEDLIRRGCSHIVVIHDLDNNDEAELYNKLNSSIKDVNTDGYIILIPVQEIEAWLLFDASALKSVFRMSKLPRIPKNPEIIMQPKEKLRDIVWKEVKKRYVNSIHNKRIAAATKISKMKKCQSFKPYPVFVKTW